MSNADAALILRCQENDAAAFNEIVSRYKNKVYNYVCRMVGPGLDAEDLTQDTFVRAFTSIKSFQSRASLNTWLFRIATNVCIDFLRKSKRMQGNVLSLTTDETDEENEGQRDVPDSRYDPQNVLLHVELGHQLDHALKSLPEKLRMVVLLHDIEGLAYEEIAQIVECPLGTVKSRLFNARAALRTRLAPYLDATLSPHSPMGRGEGRSAQ